MFLTTPEIIGYLSTVFQAATIAYILWYLLALLWNYHIASSAGIPVIIVPFYYQNIFCVNWPYIPGLAWIVNNLLPSSTASYISDIGFTTRFWLRGKRFKTQGLCYFTVSPRNIVLNVADADVVNQIMSDREGFPKPAHKYKIIDMYGSNLLTASDEDWPHHRRYIAGAFNEKNNNLVWEETLLQSGQMLSIWKSRAAPNTTDPMAIDTLNYDAMTMALHVLSSAAFGIPLYFTEATTKRPEAEQGARHEIFLDTEQPPTGFTMTYRQSILFISQNISSTVGAVMFLPSWMKVVFKHQFAAHRNLGNYLRSIVELAGRGETQAKSKYGQDSLLSLMVRATQEDSASRRVGKESGKGFTTQELMGNLFIFTVAGHESTGITLQYTLINLALHPEVQDWLCTEIDEVLADQPSDPELWSYDLFPKLVAPLCVMLETLRLYPPVLSVPKWTGSSPQPITYSGTTHTLPLKTSIVLSGIGLHYNLTYWGPDASTFDPLRWDARNASSFLAQNKGLTGLSGPGLESPAIHKPKRGSYLPFSDGFRACIGRKFVQVEFVAVLTRIFAGHRVRVGRKEGETQGMADRRAKETMDSSLVGLTLKMGEEVEIELLPR